MDTLQIDILNPKVRKLLTDLADLGLIAIREQPGEAFLNAINKIRDKASKNPLSLEAITKEVEIVRAKRHDKPKA